MYFSSLRNIKKAIALFFVFAAATTLFAKSKTVKYDELLKDGSISQIKSAFYKDYNMNRTTIGENKDSLILTALRYDREKEVISLLVKADVSIFATNKLKQNALMYVCRYSTNEETIKFVLGKYGKGKKLAKKLSVEDEDGHTSFDYANENPDKTAWNLIKDLLEEPEVQIDEQPEEEVPEVEKDVQEPPVEQPAPETVPAEPEPPAPPQAPVVPEPIPVPEPVPEKKEEPEPVPETKSVAPSPAVNSYKKTYLYDYAPVEKDEVPEDKNDTEEYSLIADPNKRDEASRTLLMNAVKSGNEWEARSLIKSKADVSLKDKDGWTALMYAARYQNDADIVQLLLDNGAKINEKNNFGSTPLQLASCYSDNPDVLKKLLDNQKTSSSELTKAFIMAITSESNTTESQIAKIKLFINKGISINRFYEGRTPLMYAAEYSKSTAVIKLLLDNGASPSIRDQNGKKAFDYASKNIHLNHDETYWQLNSR